ncbi:unnamed protein product [Cuscuta europaea]|uniref:Uncharacterized protein n=1 Tax=Cuscuta europaea TaxID=41803 RepID=A0A9P1EJA6_CUSEU|nr:unnamed protein product [Cuscuta europaea]
MALKKNAKVNEPVGLVDLSSSPLDDDVQQGTPLRATFCLKNREQMAEFDEKEDCFILDFDPFDSRRSICDDQDPEIAVVAETGNVACRDFPHPRHICVKFPFANTPHEKYCELCYCYVCDVSAPCLQWNGSSAHCHAINTEAWKHQRRKMTSKSVKI